VIDRPHITPNPNGDGVILHLPNINYLDTQAWSADVGLSHSNLAALHTALDGFLASAASVVSPAHVASAIASGYCPHCGRGDCAPTADEYEQARRRAVTLVERADAARAWARQHLTPEQQAGLLAALRGDQPKEQP
jgi:hypothetical protein